MRTTVRVENYNHDDSLEGKVKSTQGISPTISDVDNKDDKD